jgi:hypothetical protein
MTVLLTLGVLAACGAGDGAATTTTTTTGPPGSIVITSDFRAGSDGWASDVSDFSEATRPEDFLSQTGEAPPDFDARDGYFRLAASNRSDDLFMYMRRPLTMSDGLSANTSYEIGYEVEFLSDAPSGCAGIGGAPGESVWMKVGASPEEPVPLGENGEFRLSVDKGGQSEGGEAAEVAGVIANGISCEIALQQNPAPYVLVTLRHTLDDPVTSAADGSLWAFVGTDSGFEGRTSIYYDRIQIVLVPSDEAP